MMVAQKNTHNQRRTPSPACPPPPHRQHHLHRTSPCLQNCLECEVPVRIERGRTDEF
jgi:hypothetical protein